MGAADGVQFHAEFADAGGAGAQPAEQGGVGAFVVEAVGGQAYAQGVLAGSEELSVNPGEFFLLPSGNNTAKPPEG